jgi:hypothetical protein
MRPIYEHTQTGPWYLLLLAVAASQITTILTGVVNGTPWVFWMLVAVSILMILLACSFRSLTVRVTETEIHVKFGPLPLMGKRVHFKDVQTVQAARSSIVDGWGVHWNPSQGWIYNLWGFDCVALQLGKTRLRIGTDEPQELVQVIQRGIAATHDSTTATLQGDPKET